MIRSSSANFRRAVNGRLALACGHALRFLALSLALVSYGAMPTPTAGQSEIECQVQEEFASGHHFDIRHRLRGAASRRAGFAVVAVPRNTSPAPATGAEILGQRLSLGMVQPLRC